MTEISHMPAAEAGEGFRIGNVFGRSFTVLSHHFILFFCLAAIPTIPSLLQALNGGKFGSPVSLIAFGGLALLFGLVLAPMAQAITLYGAFQDMRSRPIGLGDAWHKGLDRILPIIGVAFCQVFVFAIGAVLLVVPLFIFITMYYVAIPRCVVEQLGPIVSMRRSAALTKGHRWKIFGLAIVLGAGLFVVPWLVRHGASFLGAAGDVIAVFAVRAVISAYYLVVIAVLYHDLRVAREGIDIEQIAAVFD